MTSPESTSADFFDRRSTHRASHVGARCSSGPGAIRWILLVGALLLVPHSRSLHAAESSVPAALAAKALLLDVASAGDRLFAVGEYGNIVYSGDEGKSWTQVIVPTRATLTGVWFADAKHGWAVGHDGVILATTDGGQMWLRQDNGTDLETIFLDVLFLDAKRGFAVGAYGKYLTTTDGGANWKTGRPSPDDWHFNRITRAGDGRLFLAGEAGTALVSDDEGANWTALEPPYDGSLFGVLPARGALVSYGLGGQIFVSTDDGSSWTDQRSEITVVIMAGIQLGDGRIVLAGQGGSFFIAKPGSTAFEAWQPAALGTSIADLVETSDGAIVTVGEGGAARVLLP